MISTICEFIWLKQLFKESQNEDVIQITLICDNQIALQLAFILFFHEKD